MAGNQNNTELNHEGRISVLENKLEGFIELTNENFKDLKVNMKDIEKRLNDLGNGGFKKIILETNEKLLRELLERDDKEREYKLEKKKSKWQYTIEKNKVVF